MKILKRKVKDWRQGQTIFNFLAWLLQEGKVVVNEESSRMADVFHTDDKVLDKYYEEFLERYQ